MDEMTALQFWAAYNKLCNSHEYSCEGCPISDEKPPLMGCIAWMRRNPKRAVQILMEQEGKENEPFSEKTGNS